MSKDIETKEELKKFRFEIGYTQETFANAIGVKRASYSNWETGQDKITKLKEINDFKRKYEEDQAKNQAEAEKAKKTEMAKVLNEADEKNKKVKSEKIIVWAAEVKDRAKEVVRAKKDLELCYKDASAGGLSKKEIDIFLTLQGLDPLSQMVLFEACNYAK